MAERQCGARAAAAVRRAAGAARRAERGDQNAGRTRWPTTIVAPLQREWEKTVSAEKMTQSTRRA